jgi:hypothetical protein
MGSPARSTCYGKEMLDWIHEKMATLKSAPGGGRFFASGSTTAGNGTSACNDLCTPGGDYSIAVRNGF